MLNNKSTADHKIFYDLDSDSGDEIIEIIEIRNTNNSKKIKKRPRKKPAYQTKNLEKFKKVVIIDQGTNREESIRVSNKNASVDIEFVDLEASDCQDVDNQQIQFFKQKIGLQGSKHQNNQVANNCSMIPAQIKPVKVKLIHEYPPYVLGPNDVWPPKYPNSNRSFNKQMREARRLQ